MRSQYLGDSYDIVKQCILRWLDTFGPWITLPMLTEPAPQGFVVAIEAFLSVPVASTELLTPSTNRGDYFQACNGHVGVFLDPNTGLRLTGPPHPDYLMGEELVNLVAARPDKVTVVFDQSLQRGNEHSQIKKKLAWLDRREVAAFAYVSHAAFLIAAQQRSVVAAARAQMLERSQLPLSRVTELNDLRNGA